jgi:uncharacterized membrane protein YeaQ/YmgE (transglycosylase-associated protein family)
LTQTTSIDKHHDTGSIEKASTMQLFLYYFSFFLIWATLAFIGAMLLMDYEDMYGTLDWVTEATTSKKAGFILFYILQFPLGLLFGLITGNYDNGLFAFLLNPLVTGWTLNKFLFRSKRSTIKSVSFINSIVLTVIFLTIVFYILTE